MPDSFPGGPSPSDPDRRSDAEHSSADDDAIDFGHLSPYDEGDSAALSYSGIRSGPLSGSSVLPWSDLVKQTDSPSEDSGLVDLHPPVDDETFDPASDADLLREVLADEPPPSKVIIDPSAEHAALRPPAAPDDSALAGLGEDPTALPSDISAPGVRNWAAATGPRPTGRADDVPPAPPPASGDANSSVLGDVARAADDPNPSSNVWGESSRVDLLGGERPAAPASGLLEPTDEVDPPSGFPHPDPDSATLLGDAPDDDDVESSAVDLGSRPEVDVPFPLAVDSSVGSSMIVRRGGQPDDRGPDSGMVDLLSASDEFDLAVRGGLSSAITAVQDELPPTVPLEPVGRGRGLAWAGGGVVGLLAGAGLVAGLWYAGVLPADYAGREPVRGAPTAGAPGPSAAAFAELQNQAQQAADQARQVQTKYDALTAQLKLANLTPEELPGVAGQLAAARQAGDQARQAQARLEALTAQLQKANLAAADLPAVAERLAQAQAATAAAKQSQSALDALTGQLRSLGLDPADLPAALNRLTEARTTAEATVRRLEGELTRLRDADRESARRATAAEDQLKAELAKATAARSALADFQKAVAARLLNASAAASAGTGELLAALDQALRRQPGGATRSDPQLAERSYTVGLRLFHAGRYPEAERAFHDAATAHDRDARYVYFRGLARLSQGNAQGYRDFATAAALERQNLPNPGDVDLALERVQGELRKIVNQYRP